MSDQNPNPGAISPEDLKLRRKNLDKKLRYLKNDPDYEQLRTSLEIDTHLGWLDAHLGELRQSKEVRTEHLASIAATLEKLESGIETEEFRQKYAVSEEILDYLRAHPEAKLEELKAADFTSDPHLQSPEIWANIVADARGGLQVQSLLSNPDFNINDPKTWVDSAGNKLEEAGSWIAESAKKNPEIVAAIVLAGTAAVLWKYGKKIWSALAGAAAIGLGFVAWKGDLIQEAGQTIGELVDPVMVKLFGAEKWKGLKSKARQWWDEREKKKKESSQGAPPEAPQTPEAPAKGIIEKGKRELADWMMERTNDPELKILIEKWASGNKLTTADKLRVEALIIKHNFLFVTTKGAEYLVHGTVYFSRTWLKGIFNTANGLFSRDWPQAAAEYVNGGVPFAVTGGSIAGIKAFFSTTNQSVLKAIIKGSVWNGLSYGVKIPIIIYKAGGIAEKFVYDVATKGISKMALDGVTAAAAKAERPLAKKALAALEKQIAKRCEGAAAKKFIQTALKKTGLKRVGGFVAKRVAAAGASAATGVGTAVSVGLLAWTFWDLGKMSLDAYQAYDLKDELTERGKAPIKQIYFDSETRQKLDAFVKPGITNVEEVALMQGFDQLEKAVLYIEREGKNDREKWTFAKGEIVDIAIEKV